DILTALSPYLNKENKSDIETLKEVIADKLALQRQEILNQIPHSGQLAQPKTLMEQITEFVAAMGSLKEAGPMLRSILGVPESSGNISAGVPVQVSGPDGKPLVMDLGQVINWKKFEGEERRADERQQALTGLGQTVRENLGDGIAAIKAAVEEAKGTGAKKPAGSQPTTYECSDCHTQFAIPDVPYETVKCPNPQCGRVYTKKEVMGA
ncbi:unnamed protein product, partial [marine sediment metagenome]